MKTTFKCLLLPALAALLLPLSTSSAATVENVTAKQRYPWNGKVDITCTVSGIDGGGRGALSVSAANRDLDEANSVSHVRIVRDGAESDDLTISANGDYRLVWDATADLGEVRFTNMVVSVEAVVTDRGKIQLWEGGPYWAEANIGAENPWDYGLYFWWGDTVGYRRKGSAWVASDGSSQNFSFGSGNTPTHGKTPDTLLSEGWVVSKDGTYVLAPDHDAAQVQWGGSWRMPTYQELDDLCYNKCDWTWTTTNGVNGYIVRGRGNFADASIFLPAAGCGYGTSLYYAGPRGDCWSSVPDSGDSDVAGYLDFNSGYHSTDSFYRYYGQSVRPVQGFAE